MKVTELITELQKMPPNMPVRVVVESVTHVGEFGDEEISLNDSDAMESDTVQNVGNCVLVKGR